MKKERRTRVEKRKRRVQARDTMVKKRVEELDGYTKEKRGVEKRTTYYSNKRWSKQKNK